MNLYVKLVLVYSVVFLYPSFSATCDSCNYPPEALLSATGLPSSADPEQTESAPLSDPMESVAHGSAAPSVVERAASPGSVVFQVAKILVQASMRDPRSCGERSDIPSPLSSQATRRSEGEQMRRRGAICLSDAKTETERASTTARCPQKELRKAICLSDAEAETERAKMGTDEKVGTQVAVIDQSAAPTTVDQHEIFLADLHARRIKLEAPQRQRRSCLGCRRRSGPPLMPLIDNDDHVLVVAGDE